MTATTRTRASRRPGLAPGTPVWCVAGGIPAGGRVAWGIGVHTHMVSICVFGAHFPRQVPAKNLTVLDEDSAPALGLCPGCLGFGTSGDLPPSSVFPAGETPDPCGSCGGTGRSCLRLITAMAETGAPVVALLPHGARRLDGCADGMCVACGLPVRDPQAHPSATPAR